MIVLHEAATHRQPVSVVGHGGSVADDFETVYREHVDAVYRFCVTQLGDPSAAEDCAADTFAAAFAAYPRLRPDPALVRPWLFRIARNVTIDRARRSSVRQRFLQRFRPESDGVSVERVVEQRAELRAAIAAIKQLPKRDRVLIGLRVGAGLSFSEIGSVVGMKENAARMATARALARVRMEAFDDE